MTGIDTVSVIEKPLCPNCKLQNNPNAQKAREWAFAPPTVVSDEPDGVSMADKDAALACWSAFMRGTCYVEPPKTEVQGGE